MLHPESDFNVFPKPYCRLSLAPVAGKAKGLEVFDRVRAALAVRNNVIDFEFHARAPANLAGVLIALEYQEALRSEMVVRPRTVSSGWSGGSESRTCWLRAALSASFQIDWK